jgi:hypothetical protein
MTRSNHDVRYSPKSGQRSHGIYREISSANRPETRLDATAELCQAERSGTYRAGLASAKSSIPTTLCHSHAATDDAVPASRQGNIELMSQEEILHFKPSARPEQVDDKLPKQMEDGKHRRIMR